jgi:GxxExxY protein
MKTNKDLIYADECYQLMGIIFKVFKRLGFGHKESFYQKALAEEFKDNNIDFKEQLRCKIKYKNKELGTYILDFLVFGKIVIELKQKNFISPKDIDQLYKYLRATNLKLGLIVTFTREGAKCKRVVNLK